MDSERGREREKERDMERERERNAEEVIKCASTRPDKTINLHMSPVSHYWYKLRNKVEKKRKKQRVRREKNVIVISKQEHEITIFLLRITSNYTVLLYLLSPSFNYGEVSPKYIKTPSHAHTMASFHHKTSSCVQCRHVSMSSDSLHVLRKEFSQRGRVAAVPRICAGSRMQACAILAHEARTCA